MPLIMLTGYPCSGLSYRAKQLAELLEATQNQLLDILASENDEKNTETENTNDSNSNSNRSKQKNQNPKRFSFHIVPSHDPSHPRTVYDNARTEKEARAVSFARVKRALAKDAFVILDGMNYIKGYRYQLWCEAKAVGTTCCVVHVGTPIEKCIAINNSRLRRRQSSSSTEEPSLPETSETTDDLAESDNEDAYPSELHQNLIFRYEEPSMHSRWDKPLFTVPWTDFTPPIEEIWTATTGIAITKNDTTTDTTTIAPNSLAVLLNADPNSLPANTITDNASSLPHTQQSDTASVAFTIHITQTQGGDRPGRPKIKPHQATVLPAKTDSGVLYGFEKRTSAIVTAIRNFTQSNPSAETALAQALSHTTRSDDAGISIPVPDASVPIFIPAHIVRSSPTDELAGAGGVLTLPRLQRLRRQWISQNRSYIGMTHNPMKGTLGLDQVGDAFVRFLNFELAGDTAE